MAIKKGSNTKFNLLTGNWNVYNIDLDQIYYVKLGEVSLWIRRDRNEIYIVTSIDKNIADQKINSIPEDLQWARFFIKEESVSLELSPATPDRTLVIKPEASFYLTNGSKRTIHVRIPVWIRISLAAKTKTKLSQSFCLIPDLVI